MRKQQPIAAGDARHVPLRPARLHPALLIALPPALLASTALAFAAAERWLGAERGYLLGFTFYWLVWCLLVPRLLLGPGCLAALLRDQTPLLARGGRPAALLLAVITAVTIGMYGAAFLRAQPALLMVALPVAAVNGICEELLWRGLYVRGAPGRPWLAVAYPAVGFAVWHLVPQQIFPDEGGALSLVLSALALGLAYGWVANRTGSARWTALSHSLSGFLALGGGLAPSLLELLGWRL